MTKPEWVPPVSLEEALQRKEAAVIALQDIQTQLSQQNKTDVYGRRISDVEYHEWRGRAVSALRHRQADVQRLKAAIRQLRSQANVQKAGLDGSDPAALIGGAARLFQKLMNEGVELDADELALVDLLQDWHS